MRTLALLLQALRVQSRLASCNHAALVVDLSLCCLEADAPAFSFILTDLKAGSLERGHGRLVLQSYFVSGRGAHGRVAESRLLLTTIVLNLRRHVQ